MKPTSKAKKVTSAILTLGSEADFFCRGRKVAQQLDRRGELCSSLRLSFADPVDLLAVVTPARIELFRAIKAWPGTRIEIAKRLMRGHRSVGRDISELARLGLLVIDPPAKGCRQPRVRVAIDELRIECRIR